MARLSFTYDGQSHVSDVFSGGKVVQLAFPVERTRVLYLETRLGATLPWKITDSRLLEKQLVINVPLGGEGQEYRLNSIAEPLSAEIVDAQTGGGGGGGSQPGPDSVGTREIRDDAVMMDDLNTEVKEQMLTGNDRVSQEELDNFET